MSSIRRIVQLTILAIVFFVVSGVTLFLFELLSGGRIERRSGSGARSVNERATIVGCENRARAPHDAGLQRIGIPSIGRASFDPYN